MMVFHRFGTNLSNFVDNYSSGGVFSEVDINSGRLTIAARVTEPEKRYITHPDTGVQIEGIIIPDWENIKKQVLHVHRCFPFFRFLAWDVVVDKSGRPVVIEINRGCDLDFQMIKPLRNEKLGEFMKEYGLLDQRK